MLEIKAKLKVPRAAYKVEVRDRLELAYDDRTKGGLRARLASGEEVSLNLPRGEVLRGGDLVTASDGRVVEVVAKPEPLLHIEAQALARIAYHLGGRHVPVQVGDGFLRIADRTLEEVLKKLGATVAAIEAPFEPEPNAYSGGHGDEEHSHDHGHVHDEHCGHDHHGRPHHHYESK